MLNKFKNKKNWLAAVLGVIILILIVLGLAGYYAIKKVELSKNLQPTVDSIKNNAKKELPKIIKPAKSEIKVTSFIGKILEIQDDVIKIQVGADQNQGIEQNNAIIAVKTTENTKYFEREIPKKIPEGKSPADLFAQKEIIFADLKVGDDIIAIASEDVAFKKEFIAQSVLRTKLAE